VSTRTGSWEHQLLNWAYEGIENPSESPCADSDVNTLAAGYQTCEDITQVHSRTFYLASGLLPPAKRRAARALYAFCRTTDDIVDSGDAREGIPPRRALEAWRRNSLVECADEDSPARHRLILAWTDTQTTYSIPRVYAEQLIDGVARDLPSDGLPTPLRYQTFDELTTYCYGVASTVGLMAMHIIGFSGPDAVPYAVKLGVALQLTNILRDVAEDWQVGRLYLPLEELAAFDLSEADIDQGVVDDRWRAFMQYQIDRVRGLYAASLPGIRMLHRDGRFAIGAAAELYRAILDDIEAHDMDVFTRRASLSSGRKLRRLPGIWWRAHVVGYSNRAGGRLP
jgi:15-cis-phytoene synthase